MSAITNLERSNSLIQRSRQQHCILYVCRQSKPIPGAPHAEHRPSAPRINNLPGLKSGRSQIFLLRHYLRLTRTFFFADFDAVSLPTPPMIKSSSFLPDLIAAVSHRGFSPRAAHVSAGFSGLRYFGATAPRAPPRPALARNPFVASRSNLPSWSWTDRRSSMTLVLRATSYLLSEL